MIKGAIIGLIVSYALSYIGMDVEIINTIQSFVTFEVTMGVYYLLFAVLGCIFVRKWETNDGSSTNL